jgi:hypothetical protein
VVIAVSGVQLGRIVYVDNVRKKHVLPGWPCVKMACVTTPLQIKRTVASAGEGVTVPSTASTASASMHVLLVLPIVITTGNVSIS